MKRRVPLPPLPLDRSSREPLHLQLARALCAAIDYGELSAGTPLPSTRALAAGLGISRNTVLTAYEELAAEGRVAARAGSATFIALASPPRRAIVRSSQYPPAPSGFRDPGRNQLYFHR